MVVVAVGKTREAQTATQLVVIVPQGKVLESLFHKRRTNFKFSHVKLDDKDLKEEMKPSADTPSLGSAVIDPTTLSDINSQFYQHAMYPSSAAGGYTPQGKPFQFFWVRVHWVH